ncbi:MAG: serine hydrolase domain-containing protein [Cyanobacteria bacterium P01_C01_bin.89]
MRFASLRSLFIGLSFLSVTALSACAPLLFQPSAGEEHLTQRDPQEAIADKFLTQVDAYRQDDQIPGIAVALVQGDRTLLLAGLGSRDLSQNLPVTPDTLFHIGSTHKSMTALLVATLVDDGTVNWDSPVVEIDPHFKLRRDDSTKTVTLRHLLSMRSGIPETAEDGFDWEQSEAEDLLEYVANVELLGAPGERFSYSNISTALAGYLAAIATTENPEQGLHNAYEKLLRTRILDPIAMTRSTLSPSAAQDDGNYSRSYTSDGGIPQGTVSEDIEGDPLAPSGSLKASITDMARYISTQVNGGVAPNGQRVVSAANLRETWQPRWGNYAMGWDVQQIRGVSVVFHGGSYDNFLSIVGIIPSHKMGFVILANSSDAAADLMDDAPGLLVDLLEE